MYSKITFITGNKDKLLQVQKFISIPLKHHYLNLPEIQSLDLQEVVRSKAGEAFKTLQVPVLVEDVSLVINSLGKLPGPFIKWFLKELQPQGIANLASKFEDRSAVAEVCYGFHDGTSVHIFSGIVKGSISQKVVGSNGFGWDQIFIPASYEVTRAQMETEDYEKCSPRKIALKKFEEYLIKKYNMNIA